MDDVVNEAHRLATTKLHLGSHKLKIERDRWANFPREKRLCSCRAAVQSHVLTECLETAEICKSEPKLSYDSIASLMSSSPTTQTCADCVIKY